MKIIHLTLSIFIVATACAVATALLLSNKDGISPAWFTFEATIFALVIFFVGVVPLTIMYRLYKVEQQQEKKEDYHD